MTTLKSSRMTVEMGKEEDSESGPEANSGWGRSKKMRWVASEWCNWWHEPWRTWEFGGSKTTDVRNNIEEGIISKFINIQGVREKEPLEGTAQKNREYSGITQDLKGLRGMGIWSD